MNYVGVEFIPALQLANRAAVAIGDESEVIARADLIGGPNRAGGLDFDALPELNMRG